MASSTSTRRKLTLGKIAGLRRLADEQGIFCITAMDQRNSLRSILNPTNPAGVPHALLAEIKVTLAAALSPHSTAILIDPQYGVAQSITAGALDAHAGLLISLEADKPKNVGQGKVTTIATGLSAQKIGRMGGDAVKLLVRYRPDLGDATEQNQAVVREVAEQCRDADSPFILEPVVHALESQSREDFAREKPTLVIQAARDLSPWCDLFKSEFPDDISWEKDPAVQKKHCQELDTASVVPWVILSAGADIGPFAQVVEIACQSGASGFLAGRAIWKDYVKIVDADERLEQLERKAVPNLGVVTNIAVRDALPWTEHRGIEIPDPTSFDPFWYEQY
jgi:tagatose 1,6-diphosphate aldolase